MKYSEILFVGKNVKFNKIVNSALNIARYDFNILLLGETGTGKSLIARIIHENSQKRKEPFILIDCPTIPESLFEAELFGYGRGAFTGAHNDKDGLLEVARDGTIFFDEIGDLSRNLQAKILGLIEGKTLRRIGEVKNRKISARYIFATNQDLEKEVKRGNFRKDLYFRINVVKLFIPPLRERKYDLPELSKQMVRRKVEVGYAEKRITESAIKKLMNYHFPGNVRELENIIDRAYLLAEGDDIDEKCIILENSQAVSNSTAQQCPEEIRIVLEKCKWNITKAAAEIGKSRRQFYRILEKYNLKENMKRKESK